MYGPGFSVVEISLRVFFSDAQVEAASARASVSKGSRPLGNAPACRDTTKVSGPAETDPVDVVAHPANATTGSSKRSWFKFAFGYWLLIAGY